MTNTELSRTSIPSDRITYKGSTSLSIQYVQSDIKLPRWISVIRASVDFREQLRRPAVFHCHLQCREPMQPLQPLPHHRARNTQDMALPLWGSQAFASFFPRSFLATSVPKGAATMEKVQRSLVPVPWLTHWMSMICIWRQLERKGRCRPPHSKCEHTRALLQTYLCPWIFKL